MTKRSYNRYRLLRKFTIIMAAAPLFQVSQCSTGVNQVFKSVANGLPSTLFSIAEGFALVPLQLIYSLFFQVPGT